jgi:sugar lactone lactonase YvrE
VAGNGSTGYSGDGGSATNAATYGPLGVAVDTAGNLYFVNSNYSVIRRADASTGIITTVAGNGSPGFTGDGGAATSAELNSPTNLTIDGVGNLYIADQGNNRIRKVTAATGIITTVAGNGTQGYSGDRGPATSAEMYSCSGVAVDRAGNLYIADFYNSVIRKVTTATGIITTVVGNGTFGYTGDGGQATSAELKYPSAVTLDSAGNLYIADANAISVIRKVTVATGIITTVAGNGTGGYSGDGGAATSARLNYPDGIAVDISGNLYISDHGNNRIREVTAATGNISTVVGNGTFGYSGDGGLATSAELYYPYGVAVDSAGNIYVSDSNNNRIRKVGLSTVLPTTLVGVSSPVINLLVEMTADQSISSISAAASQGGNHEYVFGTVTGCTVDGSTSNTAGTICTVPITFHPAYPGQRNVPLTIATDTGTYSVGLSGLGTAPEVAFTPGTISTVAGNGTGGYTGDGTAAASAEMNYPWNMASDSAGNIYIADNANNVIRKVTALTGNITTVAGNGTGGYAGDGGAATSAELNAPDGVAVDGAGNIYIADLINMRIRKVDTSGTIMTVAGNGTEGYTGNGGAAIGAELNYPDGVTVDNIGNIYFADSGNSVIRKVNVATGIITTVAGNGIVGYSGDGGAATSSELNSPYNVALDNAGNIYIADSGNNVIRRVAASTGIITTVAGNGSQGYSGDGGAATSAELNYPGGLVVDNAGNIYIADSNNNVIRKVATSGTITTVVGNGSPGYKGDGGAATSAELNGPQDVVLDGAGDIYIPDSSNNSIRKVSVGTVPTINFVTATNVGQTDGTDDPGTVVVSNVGNEMLTLTTPTTGNNPSYPANFPVNSSDGNLCSSTATTPLAAGASCDISALFQPTGGGTNDGTVILTDNALNQTSSGVGSATQSISLSGSGIQAVEPTCTWPTASSITFGQQLSNSTLSEGSCTSSGTTVAGAFSWTAPATTPAVGTNTESVTFTPSNVTDYLTATGSVDVSVSTATAAIATTSTLNPSTYGQIVTLTFTLSGISGGPTPTGSLTLTANGSSLGTVNLASGEATYTTDSLPAGTETIIAIYSGDSYYH